jgi:hypothetical protein
MVKEVQGGRRHLVILCRQAMYIKSNYKLAWTLIYYLWSWSFGSLFKWNVSNTEVAICIPCIIVFCLLVLGI